MSHRGDLISVTISDSEPILEYPNPNLKTSWMLESLGELSIVTEPWKSTSELRAIRPKLLFLIRLIRRLATLHRNSYAVLAATPSDIMVFTWLCCTVEYRLLSIDLFRNALSGPQDVDVLILDAARNAALMCSTYLFRNMRPHSAIFKSLQSRLRRNITSLNVLGWADINRDSAKLLLWVICVGSAIAVDPEWYTSSLSRCFSNLKIRNRDELATYLDEFVWTSNIPTEYLFATLLSTTYALTGSS
jgi:hypothetical protein